MPFKDAKRLTVLVGLAVFFLVVCFHLTSEPAAHFIPGAAAPQPESAAPQPAPDPPRQQAHADDEDRENALQGLEDSHQFPTDAGDAAAQEDAANAAENALAGELQQPPPAGNMNDGGVVGHDQSQADADNLTPTYQTISSQSTADGTFFSIDFGGKIAFNPNIIPHPSLDDTWIIVAQEVRAYDSDDFVELFCDAVFQRDVLQCLEPPVALPIAPTHGAGQCDGKLGFFNLNRGPHDARVFLGPDRPYVIFGSNSIPTCFGQFVQDFTALVDWKGDQKVSEDDPFRTAAELHRPLPWNPIEKNWFLFWDAGGQMFVHHDISPARVFAQVAPDGTVGPDLAPAAASLDEKCLEKFMPKVTTSEEQSLHQATNSLRVTMCRRSESSCVPNDENTFIITIYHHKAIRNNRPMYEPYIMAFRQRPPFEVHSMSRHPLWIAGRAAEAGEGMSALLYVTSISWKNREQHYHGYIDDELFIAFGIEDERAGGIDVLAGDLLGELSRCRPSSGMTS